MPERDDLLVPGPLGGTRILGVVLAGGASSRFGGNKALARLGGARLIDWVIAKARAQTDRVVISGGSAGIAGIEVIPDAAPGEGPLTGVLSALHWAAHRRYCAIATFSCDTPFFPDNLVARLCAVKSSSFVCCQSRRHPAFALWPVAVLDQIAQAYAAGERSLMGMQDRIDALAVAFPAGDGPQGDPFFNINRQDDLAAAEAWLEKGNRLGLWLENRPVRQNGNDQPLTGRGFPA